MIGLHLKHGTENEIPLTGFSLLGILKLSCGRSRDDEIKMKKSRKNKPPRDPLKEFTETVKLRRNFFFSPQAKISEKVKERLFDYGIVSLRPMNKDVPIPEYIKDQFCRMKDGGFVDLLTEAEKEIISSFRTPPAKMFCIQEKGEITRETEASEFDLFFHLRRQIEGLYLDESGSMRTPKGEAALRFYYATRKPEELDKECVRDPKYYGKAIRDYKELCRQAPYDYYQAQPKTKYWQLVWDALEHSDRSSLTDERLREDEQLHRVLGFRPLESKIWDWPHEKSKPLWSTPTKYIELSTELIREVGEQSIDADTYGVETMEELLYRIQDDYLRAIREKNIKVAERIRLFQVFLIAFFLKYRRQSRYKHYFARSKEILKNLERIEVDYEFEEIAYLDLKGRLKGDLLFACVFHDHIGGGEGCLKITKVGAPTKVWIKEAVNQIRYRLIEGLKVFGVSKPETRVVSLLNALAGQEIYPENIGGIDHLRSDYKEDKKKLKRALRKGSKRA